MTTQTLLLVTYSLRVPPDAFRAGAATVARDIADAPGLQWKIWGLDTETGEGTSFYLFADAASAEAFASGPVIQSLRDGPADQVTVRLTRVDPGLSVVTKAARALGAEEPAAA